jgi:hypothetical protein
MLYNFIALTNLFDIFTKSGYLLLILCCFTVLIKSYLIYFLFKERHSSSYLTSAFLFFIGILLGNLTEDLIWISWCTNEYLFTLNPNFFGFLKMFAWGIGALYVHSLILFIDTLFNRKFKIGPVQGIIIITSMIWLFLFLTLGIHDFWSPSYRWIELLIIKIFSLYAPIILFIYFITFAYRTFNSSHYPKILHKQLSFVVIYLLPPITLCFTIQSLEIFFWLSDSPLLQIPQTILMTWALWFFCKKILQLRFLNFRNHVQSSTKIIVVNDFRSILEQISLARDLRELPHITKQFLERTLNIPQHKIHLIVRGIEDPSITNISHIEHLVEYWLHHGSHTEKTVQFLQKNKIIIKDEVEFSNFYVEDEFNESLIINLQKINADVFLPVYHNHKKVAFIVIETTDNPHHLYSDLERDELIVFANYLGGTIDLLRRRNLDVIIANEKRLTEELYFKHQEINQYRESLRLFLKEHQNQRIGIVFYKNSKFVFGNEDAREIVQLNLNYHKGHPLVKECIAVATRVAQYNKPYQTKALTGEGKPLTINGIPSLDGSNTVILLIHHPHIQDIIQAKINALKDPSDWDYALYLETTDSGILINKLFPGETETILNFKISLLKTALSKKALLLNIPQEDLIPTVEIIHAISLRQQLHILDLQSKTNPTEIAIKLFGINPLLEQQTEEALFQQLDSNGTLFIKNIHLLDIENQLRIAHLIKFGTYCPLKSDKQRTCSARIICSTNQDLSALVQQNAFCRSLLDELMTTSVYLPSLLSLPDQELVGLIDVVTEQSITTQELEDILKLSDAEKNKILKNKPTSVHELKQKIHNILVSKTQKHNISHETVLDNSLHEHDPLLIKATQLGKNALKDEQLMALLWNKFQNQNKIATFLGVNRSSVNRRCKLYNLT